MSALKTLRPLAQRITSASITRALRSPDRGEGHRQRPRRSLDVRGIHGILAGIKDNPEAARATRSNSPTITTRVSKLAEARLRRKKPDAQSKALADREQKRPSRNKRCGRPLQSGERRSVPAVLKSEVVKTSRAASQGGQASILDKTVEAEYPAEWRNMLNEIHQGIVKEALKDQRFVE